MRHATILVAILAFTPLHSATAQVPVRPGERVRVTHLLCPPNTRCVGPRQESVGTFVAWKADSLVVQSNGDTLSVPITLVTRLDVIQGQKSFTLEGTVLGLLGGVVAGVAAEIAAGYEEGKKRKRICKLFLGDLIVDGGSQSEISCRTEPGVPDTWGSASWRGATIGAVLGAIAGGLIGARSMSDRWQEVPLDHVRVSVGPQRDGRFGLGLSVRF